MTAPNYIKSELKAGRSVFGTWSNLSSPSALNVIGQSGLDFVIIDLEHGPTSFETAEMQLYATESAGCTPIIRLGEGSDPTILHALDIGAQCVLVSQVATPEEAQRIVRASKYFPDGNRGLSPYTRNHGYSDVNLAEKLHRANEEMFVGVLVEGEAGMGNLDKSLEFLHRAFNVNPDPEIAAHLGEVLWMQGMKEQAIKVWGDALKLHPDNDVLLGTMKKFVP